MGNTVGPGQPSPVQSVDRALSILELLAGRGELGITELAAELGVHKSTAFRLAAALEQRGLVEQTRGRGGYRLGFGLLRLAGAMSGQMDLTQQCRPVCLRLAGSVNETVNVAVLDGSSAVNIDQVLGRSSITTHNWVGQRTPLHATSSGKVLLAHLPPDEVDAVLAEGLAACTPRTVTDRSTLLTQLARAREEDYAYTVEELEPGLNAVAAPIRGPGGRVIAAVSVSGPSFRLPEDRIPDVAATVRDAANEISALMGFLDQRQ
jgi:DNA-binding IclR family transcriptional regulator